jgi:uncharacterized membrane protein (UPF0182 family)
MPQLRLVVLALQERLAHGPTFESALASLLGGSRLPITAPARAVAPPASAGPEAPPSSAPLEPPDLNALIAGAAQDLAEYQRLTSEGKLGEAGQRLEALKRKLDELQKSRR